MEVSWLKFLEALELSAFADRDGLRYAVHNPRNGKTYLTNAELASTLKRLQELRAGKAGDVPSDEQMKSAYGFVHNIRTMGHKELREPKPFNPLFARWEAFNLGRFDAPLELAAYRIAPYVWPLFWILLAICGYLGINNNWSILADASAGLSLAGLASFALVSPFLKIPHELGHALVARYAGVNLRAAGIIFVGLFPMPYVDCSNADLQANRAQRIKISLAGVFVDICIALVFFIAWHMVEGAFWKTLCANIFLFSSLNSILFNGNPLIKLDGYYAFSDWIGRRNLATTATVVYKRMLRFITTFGADGTWPNNREGFGLAGYAVLSGLYKIYMLATIIWLILPKYFGAGLVLAVWGGWVLFLSPLFAQTEQAKKATMTPIAKWRRRGFFAGLAAIIAAAMFISVPLQTVLPVAVDVENRYGVYAKEAGTIEDLASGGRLDAGAKLASIKNLVLEQDITLAERRVEAVQMVLASVSQLDPTQTRIAREQIQAAMDELATLKKRSAELAIATPAAGTFSPDREAKKGRYIAEGGRLGFFFPDANTAQLTGTFPEKWLTPLRENNPEVTLRIGNTIMDPSQKASLKIIQEAVQDNENGARSYRISLDVEQPPQELLGKAIWAKVTMGSVPVYQHIMYLIEDLQRSFRNAQLQNLS